MKKIQEYVEKIDDELCDAKDYAEKYLYFKAKGDNPKLSKYYLEMSQNEIQHSTYLHDMVVEEIETLKKVYKPTTEMEEAWDKSHKQYVEKVAWIKQMLAM